MKPINLTVSSIWKGQVAIRDRYFQEAKEAGSSLVIHHKGEKMTIAHYELDARVRGRSATPFVDRFSKKSHYLIYFRWSPDVPETAPML